MDFSDRHIALLVDVDNVAIDMDAIGDIIKILKEKGTLDFIKFYGFNDRKHMNWGDFIGYHGIQTCSSMRFRKRNKSQIDFRLVVDAMKLTYTSGNIDACCIIAGKGDLVPVLTEMRLNGMYLYDVSGYSSEIYGHVFNERIKLDAPVDVKTTKKRAISQKLQSFSERTASLAMDEGGDKKQKDKLIAEIEEVLQEMADSGLGKESEDVEERELFLSLENLLEIIKTF